MGKINRKEHTKENPIDNFDVDFSEVDALTNEEIEEQAKNDIDSLPLAEEQLKGVKIKRRRSDNG